MSVIDELVPLLKTLRLSGVLQSLELRLREAANDNLGYEEFLYRLVKDEVERRDAKQLDQRVRRANFAHQKTLEDFDFHFNPQVPKAKVLDLATCAFVERRENALLLGQTGVGGIRIRLADPELSTGTGVTRCAWRSRSPDPLGRSRRGPLRRSLTLQSRRSQLAHWAGGEARLLARRFAASSLFADFDDVLGALASEHLLMRRWATARNLQTESWCGGAPPTRLTYLTSEGASTPGVRVPAGRLARATRRANVCLAPLAETVQNEIRRELSFAQPGFRDAGRPSTSGGVPQRRGAD
jgi:hypothetical protein